MRPALVARGIAAIALVSLGAEANVGVARIQRPNDEWRAFAGTWSASGTRRTIPTEGRDAAVVQLSGAVVLTSTAGLSAGFRGEAIGFDDGSSISAGRAVWTDAKGDRLFSALRGEALETGRHIAGTFTGGTGRYAGAAGDYEFTWQYVVAAEADVVQGRAVDVKGRFRSGEERR